MKTVSIDPIQRNPAMNTNHSPLPWLINVSSDGSLDVSPDGGDMICDLKHCTEAEANADYIVQACNAFPALVEALEAALPVALDAEEQWSNGEDCYSIAVELIRAALALARGEKGGE